MRNFNFVFLEIMYLIGFKFQFHFGHLVDDTVLEDFGLTFILLEYLF